MYSCCFQLFSINFGIVWFVYQFCETQDTFEYHLFIYLKCDPVKIILWASNTSFGDIFSLVAALFTKFEKSQVTFFKVSNLIHEQRKTFYVYVYICIIHMTRDFIKYVHTAVYNKCWWQIEKYPTLSQLDSLPN